VDEGGRPFGVIGAFYAAVRTFSSEEQEFLSQAAGLLGAGLRRLRSEREAASWRSRSDLLRSGAALLRVPAKRDSVLLAAAAAGVGGERPMADWCVADALETDGRLPVLIGIGFARARGSTQRLEHKISVPLAPAAQHGSARVYATRQPELVRECDESIIRTVFSESEHRGEIDAARPCSYVCVPVVGSHRFYGAMGFIRTEHGNPTPFDEEDVTVCSEFAGLVATAIERGEPGPDISEAEEAVRSHAGVAGFTNREIEVLLGIAAGERLAQIGRKLSISIHTVRNHKRSLCAKLGLAPSMPDARIIAEARRRGVPNILT
jgi:DNA-binding CsgD family transcriptional regulator